MDPLGGPPIDPLARAREVAARLSGAAAAAGDAGDLGKRKSRGWGEEAALLPGAPESRNKKKVYMPKTEGVNFLGLVIGPRGATQKRLSESSGATIRVCGRGSQKSVALSTNPEDNDEMHVLIEGTDEAIDKATKEIMIIFNNPEEAMRLKGEQLRDLAQLNGPVGGVGADAAGSGMGGGGGVGGGAPEEGGGLSFQMSVPNNLVGFVIGKGGENIQRMQSQTGGRIQIPKESEMKPGETHRTINLTGSPDAVADLRHRIEEIISNRLAQQSGGGMPMGAAGAPGGGGGGGGGGGAPPRIGGIREMDQAFVLKVPVPNDKVGIIIGKSGATIKSIQERTRAVVQIPTQADEDNPAVRTISIGADSEENVMAAQMVIHLALQQHVQQSMAGGPNGGMGGAGSNAPSILLHVPDDRVGGIIGKAGCNVKDIQARLRVKISIPAAADPQIQPPTRILQISGSYEAIQMAKNEIDAIVAGAPNQNQRGYGMPSGGGGGGYPMQQQQQQQQQQQFQVQQQMQMQHPHSQHYQHQHQHQQQHQQQQAYYGAPDPYGGGMYGGYGQQQMVPQQQQQMLPQVAPVVAHNPAQYYNDYWTYAAHYGEKAARLYYGNWSPPEGTLPPPGVIVAPDIDLSAVVVKTETVSAGAAAPASTSETADTTSAALAVSGVQAKDMDEYRRNYALWWNEYGKAAGAPEDPPPA